MKNASVFLVENIYFCDGYMGRKKVVDYTIYLSHARLRGFSTHGVMNEGYLGRSVETTAKAYAKEVADALGVPVIRVKVKTK